ncbi:MAG: hypothetical protein IPK31_15085 [Chitinophagaceae bacterium]|nr:hypothetical protein [Chitinophagaceae bacterium]
MALQKIKRTIHFYDLLVKFNPDFTLDKKKYLTNFQALLSQIKRIVADKDPRRYQQVGEKILFINDLTITPQPNKMVIQGKLLSVRKDFSPELLNTETDLTRDINAKDEEGIVETTHFVIQQKNESTSNKLKLALEFNQFGAKISELEYYLAILGGNFGITTEIKHAAIVRDSLKKTKQRIGEVSKITIKLHKDNLRVLQDVDAGIFQHLKLLNKHLQMTTLQWTLNTTLTTQDLDQHRTLLLNLRTSFRNLLQVFKRTNKLLRAMKNLKFWQKIQITMTDLMHLTS